VRKHLYEIRGSSPKADGRYRLNHSFSVVATSASEALAMVETHIPGIEVHALTHRHVFNERVHLLLGGVSHTEGDEP
jgi:hypothetical protein